MIEVSVPSQDIEWCFICAVGVSILPFYGFLLDFGTVPTVWYFFFAIEFLRKVPVWSDIPDLLQLFLFPRYKWSKRDQLPFTPIYSPILMFFFSRNLDQLPIFSHIKSYFNGFFSQEMYSCTFKNRFCPVINSNHFQ